MRKNAISNLVWPLIAEVILEARIELHRLEHLTARAKKMVEESPEKEKLWQFGGDILTGVSERTKELKRLLTKAMYVSSIVGKDTLKNEVTLADRNQIEEALKDTVELHKKVATILKKKVQINPLELSWEDSGDTEKKTLVLPNISFNQVQGVTPRTTSVSGDLGSHPYKEDYGYPTRRVFAAKNFTIEDILRRTSPVVRKRARKIITINKFREYPNDGLFLYRVRDYIVKVQFDPLKLMEPFKVSCSCPYWIWQGPEYWAYRFKYLYGKIRGSIQRPAIKDAKGKNLCCKHVYAVLVKLFKELET